MRNILSIGSVILNLKHEVETDGGKHLSYREAGVWFKVLKLSRGSDLDLILDRNTFPGKRLSKFCVRWETSESDVW